MATSRRSFIATAALGAVASPLPATAQQRGGGGPGRGQWRGQSTAKDGPPLARDDGEKRALEVLADIAKNQSYYNVTEADGRLLRLLAQSSGARRVVEVGTSTGYSGIWLALALKATGGRLTTFEIDRPRAATAAANFERAGLAGSIDIVIGDAHVEVPKLTGTVDLVFIDADKDGYLHYLRTLLPMLRSGGLVVADNMQVPAPDPAYVTAVTRDPALETLFLNMHATGLAVTLKKA
jgi:predicted O-methyltransferase YrrM